MLKKSTFVLFACAWLIMNTTHAQSWREEIQKDGANFYDIQKKYNEKFKKGKCVKMHVLGKLKKMNKTTN